MAELRSLHAKCLGCCYQAGSTKWIRVKKKVQFVLPVKMSQRRRTGRDAVEHHAVLLEAPQDIQAFCSQRADLILQWTANLSIDDQEPQKNSGFRRQSGAFPKSLQERVYYMIFCNGTAKWASARAIELLWPSVPLHPNRTPQISTSKPTGLPAQSIGHPFSCRNPCLSSPLPTHAPPRPYNFLCFQPLLQLHAHKVAKIQQVPLALTCKCFIGGLYPQILGKE